MSHPGVFGSGAGAVLRRLKTGLLWALCCASFSAVAGPQAADRASSAPAAASGADSAAAPAERGIVQWIERMHGAPCVRPYAGTFVVWAASGAMASSRIWHACDGQQQVERIEALTGTPRTIFRRNDEVRTFFPQSQTVRLDRRESPGLFPRVPVVDGTSVAQFYASRAEGQERVAGFMADVVRFKPVDSLRFGYKLWSERETGLVVKLQTLGPDGRVLEQAAFSELDLNASLGTEQLLRMMEATAGYKRVEPTVVKTTVTAEGWGLRQPVAGFVPVSCHRRSVAAAGNSQASVLQCLYSDGLASVSLFLEPFNAERHPTQPQVATAGATQVLGQRILPDVWLTAVGEVPLQTLRLFAGQLERLR
ncbi:MAG: MucB/RseB C-terminal domain-containing protein [Acidovorax sp.]|uniref:MucB/RseB C-terminal domain-containing protein n=1 Tax=Acidovorax sp. TaxID=1872122 RepID=UPI0025C4DB88|nr:MucB/RseB C-terminal domain-containing protein [Acidovorax sp.]MCE1192643.1 MucB/RseB C-terminal domain-containing protein [Acidovorax sp.]